MVEKMEYSTCLNIGFLNDPMYDIDHYKEYYDILILHDGNFTILDFLLDWLRDSELDYESHPSLVPLRGYLV